MMEITVVVYEDVVLSAVAGVLDILNSANSLLKKMGKPPAFKIELVSENLKNIQLPLPVQFICSKTLREVIQTDLIVVPAFAGPAEQVLRKNRGVVDWIREMNGKGTEVASLCQGSYFVAEAGILAGKSCASHWAAIEDMKRRYPDVKMLPDEVMTDQEGVYTSGGAFISLNLILYLIEKFCGREVCIAVSKQFSIEIDRKSQAHFVVFRGQRRHQDEEILKAQNYIEENYHAQISVELIAERMNMSRRNFIRRFKNATQNTPMEYMQRVKIESAKKGLEQGTSSISTLMYDAGYNDLKTFRAVFKKITGLTPQDYRRKYCRQEE